MWTPQEDFAIRFIDKTGEDRTESQLNEMVGKMREIANAYGFDPHAWGGWRDMRKIALGEVIVLLKLYNSKKVH